MVQKSKVAWKNNILVESALWVFIGLGLYKVHSIGPSAYTYASTPLLFAAGALLGSYIITIYSRWKRNITILEVDWKTLRYQTPTSQCLSCGFQLVKKDVIPIYSYIRYKGRCKYCRTPIGKSTLLCELGFGISLLLLWVLTL